MADVRVRFAPSPTGPLHIGGARSALFNYLFAKKQGGYFILRIEDTDRDRSEKEFEKMIIESFAWLGIPPDEGPIEGGDFGPYRQSERIDSYKTLLKSLIEQRKIFFCPHVKDEQTDNKFQVHWCEFRDGGGESAESILRFKTPKDRVMIFHDLVKGEISTKTSAIGDFSVAKNIEAPLYNFANVVDDYAMQITHVLRGEDHIANTPKQMLLQEALGYSNPLYGHLPLILGPDRSKLSKRHGPTALLEYKARGYLPEALCNYLALLGWNPGTDQELLSLDELAAAFSLDKVQKSGAIFDITKLDWMNGEYIRRLPSTELAGLLMPHIKEAGFSVGEYSREKLMSIIELEQPRLKRLAEIGERVDFYFKRPAAPMELLRWKTMTDAKILASLDKSAEVLSGFSMDSVTKNNIEDSFFKAASEFSPDRGALLWPLRAALSGKRASPGPFEIIAILGRDESLARLNAAREIAAGKRKDN